MSKKLLLGIILGIGLQALNAANNNTPTFSKELHLARNDFRTAGTEGYEGIRAFGNMFKHLGLGAKHGLYLAPKALFVRCTQTGRAGATTALLQTAQLSSKVMSTIKQNRSKATVIACGAILAGYTLTKVPQNILQSAGLIVAGALMSELLRTIRKG